MKSEFWGFVRFARIENSKNYNAVTNTHCALPVKQNDFWRFLVPQSDLAGEDVSNLDIVLLDKSGTVANVIGKLRRQACEEYCEFKLIVNSLPDSENYKQFGLIRSNGEQVLGTYKGNSTNLKSYIDDLVSLYESYPYAPVTCFVDGSIVTVRISHSPQFTLIDELLTVGIGKVSEKNENLPVFQKRFISTLTIPASDQYDLVIKQLSQGNIITLQGVKYIVKIGDTLSSVKQSLLSGKSNLVVASGTTVSLILENGKVIQDNAIKPRVTANYILTSGGQDKYQISIQSDFVTGNIITVTADGRTPISYTVLSGDTKSIIEAHFNTTSGYYSVNTGIVPSVSVANGTQEFENASAPIVYLTNKVVTASKVVDRYGIFVGDDVTEGNTFTLGSNTYTATAEDKSIDIAKAFGYSDSYFLYDVTHNTQFECYVLLGPKYGTSNIANVRILQQPVNKRSQQVVAECRFPALSEQYQLAIRNKNFSQIIAVGNFVYPSLSNTSVLIEYGDNGKVYDYEYYEDGLTQFLRIPGFIGLPIQSVSETKTLLLNGGFNRTETSINESQTLSVTAKPISFHRALLAALKHPFLSINQEQYYCDGDWSTSQPVSNIDLFTGSGKLTRQDLIKNNRNNFLISCSLSEGYSKILLQNDVYGLTVLIKSSNFVRSILQDLNIPANEYKMEFRSSALDVEIRIYEDGTLLNSFLVRSNTKSSTKNWTRFKSGKEYQITARRTDMPVTVVDENAYSNQDAIVTEYDCEKVIESVVIEEIEGFGFTD